MSQLPSDFLNYIFEYLENDKVSLYSCLLVNRLWCEVSVKILWKNNYKYNKRTYNTLISCLPNDSKEILSKNGIIISTPTSKPPMFNCAAFCKILSIDQINQKLLQFLKNQSQHSNNNNRNIVAQEIFKLFLKQIPSLKKLVVLWTSHINITSYPGAKECLKNLSELRCSSNINSEFFYHLSQFCHNIRSLTIEFEKIISNELANLISVQKNLKYFG